MVPEQLVGTYGQGDVNLIAIIWSIFNGAIKHTPQNYKFLSEGGQL